MLQPQKIIDMHTHIFTLKYLPVYGAIKSYVPKASDNTAKAVEKIFLYLTRSSFLNNTKQEEYPFFEVKKNELEFDFLLEQDNSTIISTFVDSLHDDLLNVIFSDKYIQKAILEVEDDEVDKQYMNQILYNEKSEEIKWYLLKRKLKRLLNKVLKGFYFFKWFLFMTKSEKRICTKLMKRYSITTKFVFHMLDGYEAFDDSSYTKGNPTYYKIEEQLQRMKKMIELKPNLIGFLPFNPFRENSLKLIKKYIGFKGFKGVKFYPSFGYKPYDKENSVSQVNNRILELYDFCLDNNIPLLTHCTPDGFQSQPYGENNSGRNCNPIYWEELLSIPKYRNLKICLGHAGGVNGWFDDFDENSDEIFIGKKISNGEVVYPYAKKVHELCVKYPNVYCEVGFLSHIYHENPSKINNYIKKLTYIFKQEENASTIKYKFSDKIMFGTDWHILYNHGIQDNYDKKYIEIFNKNAYLKKHIDKFFYKNAEKFLDIKL